MLYLTVTFFIMSSLASVVVLAALMRSAQITRQLEQNGLQSAQRSRNAASNGLRRRTVQDRRLMNIRVVPE